MKKFSKILLLLVVLAPSIFFLSRAFAGTDAQLVEGKLIVTGPGSFELAKENIKEIRWEAELPEISGTGGISLGIVKKGNFIRKGDQATIRLIKNRDTGFIHLITTGNEVYFNLDGELQTKAFYEKLQGWK